MTAAAERLHFARALIAKSWTQGAYARTVLGEPTLSLDKGAVCWCAMGALSAAGLADAQFETARYLMRALDKEYLRDIAGWNDAPDRTQADVLAAFDRAIELAEADDAR